MALKSIVEHNDSVLRKNINKHLTGVACPACGEELQESEPGVLLLSYPAKKRVKCFGCNYQGTIYA